MQPQGHMQVFMNMIIFNLNPQAALVRKGYQIEVALDSGSFGRGEISRRVPASGVFYGGTKFRTDGAVAIF